MDIPVSFAVADVVQGAAVLAAGGAGAWALAARDPRMRARAMLVALVAAAAGLATVAGNAIADEVGARPTLAAAGAVVAVALVGALAVLVRRRPQALAVLVLLALPFRVPVPVGDENVNLLLPLYVVIAAGCLAYATTWLRAAAAAAPGPKDPRVLRVERVLAVVIALYAVQALYSTDVEQALKNLCFFYVPFAVLYRLVAAVPWSRELLTRGFVIVTVLALGFAGIGLVEFATGHLIVSNPKVISANELKPYFRVNSLFFDPNIYGRFLALAMILIAALLLWTRRPRDVGVLGACLAVLWAGLVVSLSQSSFAALLVGLVVIAAVRWRPGPVLAASAAALAVGGAIVLVAPATIGLESSSFRDFNRATSGRLGLVRGGVDMARDRPVLGFGSGSFAERYRVREGVRSTRAAAISHTMPVTVAAEQGAVGLLAYVVLLASALSVVLHGARRALERTPGVPAIARVAVAAAFCALVVHTLVYAAFLEDPLTWVLLAVVAALRGAALAGLPRRRAAPASAGEVAELPVRR